MKKIVKKMVLTVAAVMVQNNTDNVDAVSGATASSATIRNAVNKALQSGLEE